MGGMWVNMLVNGGKLGHLCERGMTEERNGVSCGLDVARIGS